MSQLRFMAVAPFAGASVSCGTQRAQHGHGAAGAGVACGAALGPAPRTRCRQPWAGAWFLAQILAQSGSEL